MRRVHAIFGLGLAILALTGYQSYTSQRQALILTRWVAHTHEVISEIKNALSNIQDTETSMRGYLVVGRPAFLDTYHRAVERIHPSLARLGMLTTENPEQQKRLEALSPIVLSKLALTRSAIESKGAGKLNDALESILVARSKQLMDQIRIAFADLESAERGYLETRIRDAESASRRTSIVLIVGSFLSFLFVFLAAVRLSWDIRRRTAVEAELKKAREEALRASRYKSDFLANVSHEIRTPMNSIVGMAEVLSETQLDPEQARYVAIFRRAGQTLLSLINDVLDVSKVEAGKLEIEEQPFDLEEILAYCEEIMAFRAGQKGLSVSVEIAPGTPTRLIGDGARLRQVLLNLVGNAVKFTERGGVRVRAEARGAGSGEADTLEIRFIIADTGIGIPADRLDAVFEQFTQADDSIGQKYGGTGLGLAISRHLVQLLGGRLEAVSRVDQGSEFRFTLPFVVDRSSPSLSSSTSAASLPPLRILLVDDSADNRTLVQAYFRKSAFVIEPARDGREALDRFARSRYDVVLLDMHMPVLDGYETARALRAREAEARGGRTPIIALTAFASPEEARKCIEAGCDAHVGKPVAREELTRAILAWAGAGNKDGRILIQAPPGLADLLPGYLENRRKDLESLASALQAGNFSVLERKGHEIKGTAKSYGFAGLGEIAARLERACRETPGDAAALARLVEEMKNYIERVELG